jgi:hypothetical protein
MADAITSTMTPSRIERGIVKLNDMRLNAMSSGDEQLADEYTRQIKVLGGELKMADPEKQAKMQLEQKQAQEALATGTPISAPTTELGGEFKSAFPNVPTMESATKEVAQFEGQLPNLIGNLFQTSPDKVDIKSGLPARDRVEMGFLPTPEDKLTYLKQKYGDNSVFSVNIAGNQANVVKRKDGSVVLADEVGVGMKDILDLSGEVAPTVAAVGAAIVASPSTVGAVGVSGGAYLGVSSLQDALAREMLGVRVKPGEILRRRGVETALGMGMDVATMGLGKIAARRIGKGVTNEIAKSLEEDAAILARAGFPVDTPAGAGGGVFGLEKQKELAARFPTTQIKRFKNIEQLQNFQETLTSGKPTSEKAFTQTLGRLRSQYDNLVSSADIKDKKVRQVIDSNINRKLDELQNPTFKSEPIGEELLGYLEQGKQTVNDIKNKAFNEFWDEADASGISAAPDEVADVIKSSLATFKQKRNTGVDSIVSDLNQRTQDGELAFQLKNQIASGKLESTPDIIERIKKLELNSAPIGIKELNEYVQIIQDVVPSGGATAGKTQQQVASVASNALRQFRDGLLDSAGLSDKFKTINSQYVNDVLLFERNAPGSILKEVLGDQAMTPTGAVNRAIQDPKNIRDVIRAVELGAPERAPYMRGQLQKAYLNKIGLTADRGAPSTTIGFDPEIVTELFGISPAGRVNENYGRLMVDKLNALNSALADKKINVSNVDSRDISELYSALSEDARRSVIKKIVETAQYKSDADKMLDNTLISAAKKGDWGKLDVSEFSKTMFRAPLSDINSFLTRMPKSERKSLQSDFVAELLSRYSSSGDFTSNGVELFDGSKFLRDFAKDRTLGTRIRNVMGEEFLGRFKAAANHIAANKVTEKEVSEVNAKILASRSGITPWVVSRPGWVSSRIFASMHDSDSLLPLLRLYQKNVTPEQLNSNMKKAIVGLVGTRRGLESLANQSRNDPEFAAESQNIIDEAVKSGMIQK